MTELLQVFEEFRMQPTVNDQYTELGRPKLIEKMSPFVSAYKPIKFSMLGYPMKSPNDRDKVLGKLPDLGEQVSIENFARFAALMKDVYRPGVEFSIISDGFIFADIMQVNDRIVEQYEERVKDMSERAKAPITWYDMTSFFPRGMSMLTMREKIMEQFGITSEILEQRILMDPDVNSLYRGMIYFMNGDLAIREYPSRSQLQKHSKIVAREMMFRNEAYSRMIQHEFADHIRLSMHQSVNNGTKYSFQLIPGPKAKHSPWHSALLINKDGTLETIHKAEAFERKAELVDKDGQPYYFQEV